MDKYERRRLNLIELRDKQCNGKAVDLAKKINRDPSYVSRMFYPENKPGKKRIADDMMEVIEEAFSLPRGWLDSDSYLGEEIIVGYDNTPMLSIRKTKEIDVSDSDEFVTIKRVDLKLSAGITGYSVEYLNGDLAPIVFRKDWVSSKGYDIDKLFALKVSGHSMETSLYDDDLVVINAADSKLIDGEVYAANYEGELVIKRMIRQADGWYLSSDNPDKRKYADKLCHENCIVIGRVIYKQSERI